jgi:outer membrane protein assembly factor BamB
MSRIWVYGGGERDLHSYTDSGTFLASYEAPGENANDVDLEVAAESLVVAGVVVPAGTLLFVNGETGPAEIYALDATTGTVLATLSTAFGVGHVVGGGYHPGRRTFFLVQDNQPPAPQANLVAEIDLSSGQVLNTFSLAGTFSVYYGDLEVCAATGNLLIVSSSEPHMAEFSAAGRLVRYRQLPQGVTSLSGIGIDDGRREAWVSSTGGTVWRLGDLDC